MGLVTLRRTASCLAMLLLSVLGLGLAFPTSAGVAMIPVAPVVDVGDVLPSAPAAETPVSPPEPIPEPPAPAPEAPAPEPEPCVGALDAVAAEGLPLPAGVDYQCPSTRFAHHGAACWDEWPCPGTAFIAINMSLMGNPTPEYLRHVVAHEICHVVDFRDRGWSSEPRADACAAGYGF